MLARPPWPVRNRPDPGQGRQAGAAGQHRPRVQCRAGLRRDHREHRHCPPGCAGSLGAGDRPGAGGRGLPGADHRSRPRPPARDRSWPGSPRACPVPAPRRSPHSTSSPTCSPTTVPTGSMTTSSSIPPRQATPSGCCSCPVRGPISWRPARETPPAWARSPGWRSTSRCTPRRVQALTDPARTRLVLVSRAQTSSLSEIERTYLELNQIGIGGGYVVVNGVLPEAAGGRGSGAGLARPGSGCHRGHSRGGCRTAPRCTGSEAGQHGRHSGT